MGVSLRIARAFGFFDGMPELFDLFDGMPELEQITPGGNWPDEIPDLIDPDTDSEDESNAYDSDDDPLPVLIHEDEAMPPLENPRVLLMDEPSFESPLEEASPSGIANAGSFKFAFRTGKERFVDHPAPTMIPQMAPAGPGGPRWNPLQEAGARDDGCAWSLRASQSIHGASIREGSAYSSPAETARRRSIVLRPSQQTPLLISKNGLGPSLEHCTRTGAAATHTSRAHVSKEG